MKGEEDGYVEMTKTAVDIKELPPSYYNITSVKPEPSQAKTVDENHNPQTVNSDQENS